MGLETIALISAGLQVGGSILGGIQQQEAYEDQAKIQEQQAEEQARQLARENIQLEKAQKVAYLSSGVSLEGSPLLVMAEDRRIGQENIQNTLETGRTQASSLRKSGRQALIGGLVGGASAGAKSWYDYKSTFKE